MRGRPPNPLDPDASAAAALGAGIRERRVAAGLTLEALGRKVGYSPQHIARAEQAKTSPSEPFVEALDRALGARGSLLAQLEAVTIERAHERREAHTAIASGAPAASSR